MEGVEIEGMPTKVSESSMVQDDQDEDEAQESFGEIQEEGVTDEESFSEVKASQQIPIVYFSTDLASNGAWLTCLFSFSLTFFFIHFF